MRRDAIDAEQAWGWVQRSASAFRCPAAPHEHCCSSTRIGTAHLVYVQPGDARASIPCPRCGGEHQIPERLRQAGQQSEAVAHG